ncbi:MAG TPA: hypothetical protein VGX03_10350 [Candidatus Binatia bacterium]|nr:hypothetical protein [Candidatus Binatia bacterium]
MFHLGDLAPAQEYSERGIPFYNPQQHRSHAFLNSPHDPGVLSLAYLAWTLSYLGYSDQAQQRISAALTLAQELSHPLSLAVALTFSALLHQYRRERQAAQEQAEALIALCTNQGFPYWLTPGIIIRGWTLADQGQETEGIAQIRQGLAVLPTTGTELDRPYFFTLLAAAYGKGGQAEQGLSVLAEALVMVDKTRERVYEAELYRLKGELSLQLTPVTAGQDQSAARSLEEEAEECFHQAITIARRQSAKSLELRAVMSLSRLWQQQGKKQEAHALLAEIYDWFTEGFDTKDLQEAKALLAKLP